MTWPSDITMSEETAERPKPDRSVTPLPKVLVQQASEEKSETANDVPAGNAPEYAQVQSDAPQAEAPIANGPQPSPETGESSKPQEQANGTHAPSESEEIENPREAESRSALSTHTNDSENDRATVVEYEMNDLTASSSQIALLDQIKREKDAEMEALKDQIQDLRGDINRLHKEKEAEHQKVSDMSLQIRRMEGDNTNNFKTIQNYELKVRTLEDKLEKHNRPTSLAQQERQVRNGTATKTTPTDTTKKSSVCLIL